MTVSQPVHEQPAWQSAAASGPRAGRICQLLVDPPAGGAWNMAVDEALLDVGAEQQICTLRFYRWAEPTLSLGYFQGYQERGGHAASRTAQVVRRSSGGGAILHDRELTYSLTMPGERALADDSTWLYHAVHEALIETLAAGGSHARQVAAGSPAGGAGQPFLCFERRSTGDVVLAGAKICGSAQRRRRGALLQHGSLILGRSPSAPELAGLAELTAGTVDQAELIAGWSAAIARRLGVRLEAVQLSPALTARAERLVAEKYGNPAWTQRR